jgi:hypothetical protein
MKIICSIPVPELVAEIIKLREELAAANRLLTEERGMSWQSRAEALEKELSAANSQIEKMREALEKIITRTNGPSYTMAGVVAAIAGKALAPSPSAEGKL